MSPSPRRGRALAALLAGALVLALAGCAAGTSASHGAQQSAVPGYVTEPFSHQQRLIAQGAHLVVSDGCAACHLIGSAATAPSFSHFAGHHVTQTDGHSVLVAEQFVRESLLDPRAHELRGYAPAPMLAALVRLHLSTQPQQVAALAAFIEQVGPDSE